MSDPGLYFFMAVAASGAVGLLRLRNLFHAALSFLLVVLCVAAIGIFFQAEFLGVTQVLVYAGGIVVIIIFGIMLTTRATGRPLITPSRNVGMALTAGILLFGLLTHVVLQSAVQPGTYGPQEPYLRQLGGLLMSRHSLAFELAGVLLLVSLLAAAVIIPTPPGKDE
jgi:NADH-quinone oxidoreductase subunit J